MKETPTHSRKLSLLVAVLILLAGVFLGGYLVLKSGKVSAGQLDDILKGNSVDPAACEPNTADANKDSDNDGLKDWQEIQIYQSDPCKTDSDNDGYLDGEEVSSGYNPIIKAPGDELPGTTPKGPRPLPANLTNALGSMLAQQIATGKIDSFNQNGQILSAAELEKYPALQQSVAQIVSAGDQLFAPEAIDDSQIKITADNSKTALIKYFDDIKNAIYPQGLSVPDIKGSDAELFLSAMESDDFSELNSTLNDYQEIYERLKKVVVPTNIIPLYKEQLDIYSITIKVYQAIRNSADDPLKASLALQAHSDLLKKYNNWTLKIQDFLSSMDIPKK